MPPPPPPRPGDPGRVTLRRLTKAEYHATIRDLLAVDETSSPGFPSDDVGYGFDRIGDVLSLPPLLLEKYLSAAERISEQAIVVEGDGASTPTRRLEAEAIASTSQGGVVGRIWKGLFTSGDVHGEVRLPREGEYRLRVRTFAQQAGDEPAKVVLLADGGPAFEADVTGTEKDPQVVETLVRLRGGTRVVRRRLSPTTSTTRNTRTPRAATATCSWTGSSSSGRRRAAPAAPGEPPPPVRDRSRRRRRRAPARAADARPARHARVPPAGRARRARPPRGARRRGRRGRRRARGGRAHRPPGDPRLAALPLPGGGGRRPPDDPRGVTPLDDYALAARLSYFLWSTMPDAALTAAAARGEPRRRRRRRAADARRPAGRRARRRLRRPVAHAPPPRDGDARPDRFPAFDDRLRADMLARRRCSSRP